MSKPVKKGEERPVPKPELIVSDLPETITQALFELAGKVWKGAEKTEQELAEAMKRGADEQFEGGWHCVVGKHFAAFVTHESDRLVMFQMGTQKVLLFKHG